MTVKLETIEKMVALLDRFVTEGDYDDYGDYCLKSDMPDNEDGGMIPAVVQETCQLLREIREQKAASGCM